MTMAAATKEWAAMVRAPAGFGSKRASLRRTAEILVYLAAASAWTTVVSAHLGHAMGGGECRITVDLSDERSPRLEIGLGLLAESARAERSSADRNGDGLVSAEEGNARLDQLGAQ